MTRFFGEGFLIKPVEIEYLLRVLTDRHVTVAHCHQYAALGKPCRKVVKALYALGIAPSGTTSTTLFSEQVQARIAGDKVQPSLFLSPLVRLKSS